MSQLTKFISSSGPGSGTVTSISASTGITLTPDPITTTGSVGLTIPVVVTSGGTGAITLTNHGVLLGQGTNPVVATAVGATGQVLTGVTGGDPVWAAPAASSISLTGDTGGALVGSAFTIYADQASANAGATVAFNGVGTTLTFDVTDVSGNTIIGNQGGNATISGTGNTALGQAALNALTSGDENVAMGGTAGNVLTTGNNNTLVGTGAGLDLDTGSSNIALGHGAALSYTGAESNNIIIGNAGTLGDSAKIRIGTNGTQTATHIVGIDGVNVGSVAEVVTMSAAGDQLGTAVITAGANITVTPGANTITIAANSGSQVVNYVSVNNGASPYNALATDYYISADVTLGVVTIRLPNAPTTGRVFVVKDQVGLAATNNVTVTTVGGAVNIDGATSFVMNTAYQAAQFIFNGVSYEVY